MRRLRIAVVGCGYIAQAEHIPALLLLDNAELSAVVDLREATASQVGERLRVPHFTSLEACLKATTLDAVDICVPKTAHLQVGLIAARARKHILIEKPLATNARDAAALADEASRNNLKLQVGYNRRFDSDCLKIKQMLEDNALGEVRYISSIVHPYAREDFGPHYLRLADTEPQTPGRVSPRNVLLEVVVHHINLLRFLVGGITEIIFANYANGVINLSFQLGNGAIAYHTTLLDSGEHGEEVSVYGTKRSIHTKLWVPHWPYEFAQARTFCRETHERTTLFSPRLNAYAMEIRDFASCVLNDQKVRSDGEDGVRDLELIEHICRVCPAFAEDRGK